MDNEEQIKEIKELKAQVESLIEITNDTHDRIKFNQAGIRGLLLAVRTLFAAVAFGVVVIGVPIAEGQWNGKEFSFTRDTSNPWIAFGGGLVAASLFAGEKPSDLLKLFIPKK